VVPAGVYDWFEWSMNYNTNLSAPVSVGGTATIGGFYSGTRRACWAPHPYVPMRNSARVPVNYERVRLEEGDFNRVVVGLRLAYAFTRACTSSRSPSTAIRIGVFRQRAVRVIGPAGTGLFLVFNEGRETGENARPLDRALVVKFTRQLDLGK
jgi:hypothetical protein